MTIREWQKYIRSIRQERQYVEDIDRLFILWTEELGELANEYKYYEFFRAEKFEAKRLEAELADVFLYTVDLADLLEVDLDQALKDKEQFNNERFGGTTEYLLNQPVSALQKFVDQKRQERGFSDTREYLLILLMSEVGEVAKELRKRWKGKMVLQEYAHELADCMYYILRLANLWEVDLDRAAQAKEQINKDRTWEY